MTPPTTEQYQMNRVVADFCAEVVKEPLCYFSEADLQSMLFARLATEFSDRIETKCERGPKSKGKYRTSRVHREYGATSGKRMDLSIFSCDQIATIDSSNLTAEGEYIKPCFVIEIGTEKTSNVEIHIKNDLSKLSNRASERGYLLHFFRDVTVSGSGTTSRKNTEDKLERIYKEPIRKELSDNVPAHVSYLCFLIRIARSDKKIWGKCEMFIVNQGKGYWQKVNLINVRTQVLNILNGQDKN